MTPRNVGKIETALAMLREVVERGPNDRWTAKVRTARNMLWGALKRDIARERKRKESTDGE